MYTYVDVYINVSYITMRGDCRADAFDMMWHNVHVFVHVYVYAWHMYIHTYMYIHIYIHVCIYTYIHTCMYICTYIKHVCMYIHTYIHVCMYIHTHVPDILVRGDCGVDEFDITWNNVQYLYMFMYICIHTYNIYI